MFFLIIVIVTTNTLTQMTQGGWCRDASQVWAGFQPQQPRVSDMSNIHSVIDQQHSFIRSHIDTLTTRRAKLQKLSHLDTFKNDMLR